MRKNWIKTFLLIIFIGYVLSILGNKVTILNSIILIVIAFVFAVMGVNDEDKNRERIIKNMRKQS
jgi:uncharacterized protein YacL